MDRDNYSLVKIIRLMVDKMYMENNDNYIKIIKNNNLKFDRTDISYYDLTRDDEFYCGLCRLIHKAGNIVDYTFTTDDIQNLKEILRDSTYYSESVYIRYVLKSLSKY
jgi:hypothetical protein